ncbi:MAG: PTS sugar transporter subunit IIA [Candidatus Hydrogenedentes bacterium]|nr:PTS sugar transporter subunit IIA [Candidatus Hydrogenedentota bacterium]
MQLTDHIPELCLDYDLKVKNKSDALRELTHLLFDEKKMKGMGPALDQIMARETTESTGIGHGIAVPHARVSGLKTLTCSVGIVREGLEFGALDKKPVHVIFLICYPPTQQTTYLNFIATISKLLRVKENMKALLECDSNAALVAVLQGMSEGLEKEEERYSKQMPSNPADMEARDAHADLVLLARLQLFEEMYESARTGKRKIKDRIQNIRELVNPKILKQYDRLMKNRAPAVVPVEGDTCQGCFMKLPSQFAQRVRQDTDRIHTCNNCSRFIYVV